MIVRFRRGNMTETHPVPGKLDHLFPQRGNVTDISNFPFPSSLQNTETRYFVLWGLCKTTSKTFQEVITDLCTYFMIFITLHIFLGWTSSMVAQKLHNSQV